MEGSRGKIAPGAKNRAKRVRGVPPGYARIIRLGWAATYWRQRQLAKAEELWLRVTEESYKSTRKQPLADDCQDVRSSFSIRQSRTMGGGQSVR